MLSNLDSPFSMGTYSLDPNRQHIYNQCIRSSDRGCRDYKRRTYYDENTTFEKISLSSIQYDNSKNKKNKVINRLNIASK